MRRLGWDIDLRDGLNNENAVIAALRGRIEVKMDGRSSDTGNLFLEYECNGKPSGIAATEAEFWCFSVGNPTQHHLLPTEYVKKMGRFYFPATGGGVVGGDDDKVRGVLIPFSALDPSTQRTLNDFWVSPSRKFPF